MALDLFNTMSQLHKRQVKSSPGSLTIVTLDEAKLYLRETNSDQDDNIQVLINAAIQFIESQLDYPIDTDELIYQYSDQFVDSIQIWHRYITDEDLVVEYWDDTTWTAADDTLYRVSVSDTPPKVFLRSGQVWPAASLDAESVRVGFKIDTTHSFLNDIKGAVLALVAHQYENLEGTTEVPPRVMAVINRHKMHS